MKPLVALLASTLPFCAMAEPTAPPEAPTASTSLKDQLIGSLRQDLDAARAEKEPSREKIQALATALDQIARFEGANDPYGRSSASWNPLILANGSKRSGDLSLALVRGEEKAGAAASVQTAAEITAAGKRFATRLFAAKSSTEIDDLLRELAPLIEAHKPQNGRLTPQGVELTEFRSFAVRWQDQLAKRETGQMSSALDDLQFLTQQSRVPPFVDRVTLFRELASAASAAGKPTPAEVTARLDRIIDTALKANTVEAIDALIVELQNLSPLYRTDDGRESREKIEAMLKLLVGFQDALMAIRDNQPAKLTTALDQLSDTRGYYRTVSVPRSKLLDRVAELRNQPAQSGGLPGQRTAVASETPEAVLARMDRLEAITPNYEALTKATHADPNLPDRSNWIMTEMSLRILGEQAIRLQQGLGGRRAVFQNDPPLRNPEVTELLRQYDMLCMNICFAEASGLMPAPKETAESYAQRLKPKLVELKKWELLQDLATACRTTKIKSAIVTTEDEVALSSYLYGMRLATEVKDLRLATCAFQSILSSPSKLIPATEVSGRLEAIRKANPQAYQQGSELALSAARTEGRLAPGERRQPLEWLIPARKPKA